MQIGERLSVEVEAIANGFLVRERRSSDYRGSDSPPLFYPTMAGVEAELVIRLRAAADLPLKQEDF